LLKTADWQIEELNTSLSPLQAYARLKEKNTAFLNSAGNNQKLARFSIIATHPETIFIAKNGHVQIKTSTGTKNLTDNPLEVFERYFREKQRFYAANTKPQDFSYLPFTGGAIGFLSYDCNHYIENLSSVAKDDLYIDDMYFIFPQAVIVFDKKELKSFLITANEEVKDEIYEKLKKDRVPGDFVASNLLSNMSEDYFENCVKKIIDYIYAGDVYQVNFSQRFQVDFDGDPLVLYQKLCEINPSPFSSYIEADDFSIVSSSPERLIQLNKNEAQTRPIAGTRRRGSSTSEDTFLKGDLLLDEKEKAEHIMLVDLERNDLGRVCSYNSIHVDELYTIEKYSHVIHIVSNVKGKLDENKNAFDLVKAVFPGGTITGCPKVRCMEIIEELEPTKRGPYTGSIGYFSYNGKMDLNIIIRTFIFKKDRMYFQAGAGIVADSVPQREYFETISKANALLQSLGISSKEVKWELMSS
jgi:para-aminobenzoate synthetase component 1